MSPPSKEKLKEKKKFLEKRLLRRRNATARIRHNRLPSETPPPPPPPKPHVIPKPSTNKVWENIVIHYLNKLRSAWGSTPKNLPKTKPTNSELCMQDSTTNFHKGKFPRAPRVLVSPDPCTSVDRLSHGCDSKSKTSIGTAVSLDNSRKKAMNIVTNALEYGQAKGLISKNGKFFWLRNEKSLPKVGKRLSKSPCKECNVCQFRKEIKRSPPKSLSLTTVSSDLSLQHRFKSYLKPRTKHPVAFKKYRKKLCKFRYLSDSDCSCSKCRKRRR